MLGVHPFAVGIVLWQVDEVEHHDAAGQAQRRLHRVGEPPSRRLLDREPVDDHLDRVLLVLLQHRQLARAGRRVIEPDRDPVDPGPGVALGLQLAEQLGVLPLAAADDRREDLEPGVLVELEHPVDDLLRRLPRDRAPALRAVRLADPGEQQPQVVVDLGDGADRRPRVAARRLLVDRDGRGQPVDEVHIWLVHLAKELPGVRRQRLDVPALTFGEDRVEREARLPRAGQPGEDDHGVPRQVQRDILEVVLASTADYQSFCHCALCFSWSVLAAWAVKSGETRASKARGQW